MKVITHIAAGAVISTVAGILTTPAAGAGLFITSGFLDIDHIRHYKSVGFPMTPRALIRSTLLEEPDLETKYSFNRGVPCFWGFPICHCIELILLLIVLAYLTNSIFLAGSAAGILLHLLLDVKHYPCSPFFFSILWRAVNRKCVLKAWETWKAV